MAKNNSTPKLTQLPLPIEDATVSIPLTKGFVTIVDAIDADLACLKWYAQTKKTNTYAFHVKDKKDIGIHRIILERKIGRELLDTEMVDHINRNGIDNRRENLRVATRAENNRNSIINKPNKTGYKGVSWHGIRGTWRARVYFNNKPIDLGYYRTPEEAYEAYKEGVKKYHGEFAKFE